jgi:nucleotide-binding universal stress UspA family protein
MKNLSSILLLVERGDQGHQALNKALLLARHFRARLELFLCDTERYSFPSSSGDGAAKAALAAREAEAREYVQALRKTILAPEVEVSSDAVCHVSLRAAVADKLRRSPIDLVVKAAHSIDWPLVASCAAPILLTRGRPWHPVPRFAAAIDLQDRHGAAKRSAIARIAHSLSRNCGAQLETLFADSRPESELAPQAPGATVDPGAQALPPDAHAVHRLFGEPSEVLPRFVAQSDYDLIVMGKPRHHGPYEPAGSVAARVVKASAGDVLFVDAVVEDAGVEDAGVVDAVGVDAVGGPIRRQDSGCAVTALSARSSGRGGPES